MICDLCGKSGRMFKAEVEGSRVIACESCSKYGKILHELSNNSSQQKNQKKEQVQTKKTPSAPEVIQTIVKDYAFRIKNAREKKGIKQEDFAKKINEKESLIHHLESGKMEPNLELARKLERALNIKLIEEVILENEEPKTLIKSNGPLTLGDILNLKR